jgi:hypothetical protein
MATAEQIINRSFRENNLLGLGKLPSDAQRAEALELYSAMLDSIIGTEVSRRLVNWASPNFTTAPTLARAPLYPGNLNTRPEAWPYPPANVRILTKLDAPQTIYFQQFPPDGALMGLVNVGPTFDVNSLTINGNGFKVEGQSQIVFDTETSYTQPIRWFFRADLGEWKRLTFPQTLTDEQPFAGEFDDFLVAALAIRLAPLYGKSINDVTVGIASTGMENIRSRYYQDTPDANMSEPFLFNSYTSFGNVGGYDGGWYGA